MIRAYRPGDRDAVIEVWAAATAVAHPFLDAAFLEQERREIRELHLPNAETWVWESGGRVTGFIALVADEVGAIFVEPGCQRSGIGRALMDHAKALRGRLEVEVFEANAIGRAFYARYGFEPIGARDHAPTGQRLLRLRLRASEP